MFTFDVKIKNLAKKYVIPEGKVFRVISNAEREFGKLTDDTADELIRLLSEYDANAQQPETSYGESPLNRIDGRGVNKQTRHQVGDDAQYISSLLYARKSNTDFANLISKLEKN